MCVSDEAWAPAVGFVGAFPSAGRLKREELGAGECRQGELAEGITPGKPTLASQGVCEEWTFSKELN